MAARDDGALMDVFLFKLSGLAVMEKSKKKREKKKKTEKKTRKEKNQKKRIKEKYKEKDKDKRKYIYNCFPFDFRLNK